ncbi:DUF6641 family protein [Rheinheimera sp. F8]|uniref:DUF6641 family protein n=1 Tax=Rheinheimera sp. F8 TaxID=1763998 RepID=UPI000744C7AA|nr:DUF6641 family protein [Rheinheimera sp. F8]ALZ77330.1 hypothetical protein ATY27_17245 [Rheinheimera sp. F8]
MTTLLSTLKVIDRPKIEAKPPILGKRMKLIDRLEEQLTMAKAMLDKTPFEAFREKSVKDPETGERKTIRKRRSVRPWYYDSNEHYYIEIKVGLKAIELEKGKTAIDVGPKEQLPDVINTIIQAVEKGELDTHILAITSVKAGEKRAQKK